MGSVVADLAALSAVILPLIPDNNKIILPLLLTKLL